MAISRDDFTRQLRRSECGTTCIPPASKAVCSRSLTFKVKNVGNCTVTPIRWEGRVCRYTRLMYNISRSESGGVVLQCNSCSHSERVNEFDERQGSRRTQAAQAMLNHTRNDNGREPVGRPMPKALESLA
jgi:hypothetical protein